MFLEIVQIYVIWTYNPCNGEETILIEGNEIEIF